MMEFVTNEKSHFFVLFCYSNQVRELETDPLFNSGRGSALTAEGTVEMEASIMDGNGRRCGAVSGLTTVKNPVSLARLVMEKSPHSYLAFSGAEDFARKQVFFLPFYFTTSSPKSEKLPSILLFYFIKKFVGFSCHVLKDLSRRLAFYCFIFNFN
jgi:hypothetical protein